MKYSLKYEMKGKYNYDEMKSDRVEMRFDSGKERMLSMSPQPHSMISMKMTPEHPRIHRRHANYKSECPSPNTSIYSKHNTKEG